MSTNSPDVLVGNSDAMVQLNADIDRIAGSVARVLITGERGVGKTRVARAIHERSPRGAGRFIGFSCEGVPEGVLELELFGDVNRAAGPSAPAKLEAADQGTLFLKAIDEMSTRLQGVLLQFLGSGQVLRTPANPDGRPIDVRLIAASTRDLQQIVAMGMFRQDLFYRLNPMHLIVPPLRARKADIPRLVEYFLERFIEDGGSPVRSISPGALSLLTDYDWPGNVRELERVIERVASTCLTATIGPDQLPPGIRAPHQRPLPRLNGTHSIADDLYRRLVENRESFWSAVYPLYMRRDITRENLREIVKRGLQETRGNYRIMARLFNLAPADYKRFLTFLRKHECQLPFKEYRQ